MPTDRPEYQQKKAFFNRMLTICGRKPVLEALESPGVQAYRLHLSERNRPADILNQIQTLAEQQGAEICHHSPQALSRISKSARQDQGVALDIRCPGFQTLESFLDEPVAKKRLIAMDRITNPQNLGMIIRSITASPIDGLIIPRTGCAPLNALVIKASAGALFKAPLIQVDHLGKALQQCRKQGFQIASLAADAKTSIFDAPTDKPRVFVLGNETEGVSADIRALCDQSLAIPMAREVESLNVAVTASLIAFLGP